MKENKNEQQVIDAKYWKNYESLKKMKKEWKNIKILRSNLSEKSKKVKKLINNFDKSINYWTKQNKQLENKIFASKNQIYKLEKDKINKIKNFFINLFSFGKINKNKKLSQLIETEEINYQALNRTKLNNKTKIDTLNVTFLQKKEEHANLITAINALLENENELLLDLINYEKHEKPKMTIMEVNEQLIDQYETEIFQLNEKKCERENQQTISSNDEANSRTSISNDSLDFNNNKPLKKASKPLITKAINKPKNDKPWEQTLREYDYQFVINKA